MFGQLSSCVGLFGVVYNGSLENVILYSSDGESYVEGGAKNTDSQWLAVGDVVIYRYYLSFCLNLHIGNSSTILQIHVGKPQQPAGSNPAPGRVQCLCVAFDL